MRILRKTLAGFLALLLAVPAVLWQAPQAAALSPLDTLYDFAGRVDGVTQDASHLVIKGTLPAAAVGQAKSLSAYVVEIYENETLVDFRKKQAFYTTDKVTADFSISVPKASLPDKDSRYGQVFTSKVALVLTKENGETQLVDYAKYLDNPETLAVNTNPQPAAKSIKGVGTLMPSDLERLGVQHTSINVLLWEMLTLSDHGDASIPYEFEGETYYFRKEYINSLDNTLSNCLKNNMSIFGIFIMKNANNANPDSPAKYYAHPDSTRVADLVGVNMKDERGIQYYKAIMHFIAERYSRPDGKYGRFDGYVVGNEIGASETWNNMGLNKSLNDYVDEYTRWLRITNTIVRSYYADVRIYASFDHGWTSNPHEEQKEYGIEDYAGYSNRDIIDAINKTGKLQGDFDWSIAWHPYPENIFDPQVWNAPKSTNSFDTTYIGFNNLQVLPAYMRQKEMLYKGKARHIALTEQGFTSRDNSEHNQLLQAAAYAYAYYKALCVPGIDLFSMNGHIDNTLEMNLLLGLWSAKEGTVNTPDFQKKVYDVFKYIDTTDSLKVTQPMLEVISESMGKKITRWDQLIPEFDEELVKKLCSRPVTATGASGTLSEAKGTQALSDGTLKNWQATDDTQDLQLQQDAERNKTVPTVSLTTQMYSNFALNYRGMTYMVPKTQRDFSEHPIVSADVRIDGIQSQNVEFLVRAYSGDRVVESTAQYGQAGQWNTVSLDMTGWAGLSNVDRIKVWVRSAEEELFGTGTISVDHLRRHQSATLKNLTVYTDKTEVLQAGETIVVTIDNRGNETVSGKAVLRAENGLAIDVSSKDILLKANQKIDIPVKITEVKLQDYKAGGITVTVHGQTFAFPLTRILTPDCEVGEGNKAFIGRFENGLTDGWTVDEEKTVTAARSMTEGIAGGKFPSKASEGDYFLQVERSGNLVASQAGYTIKTFRQPRDFSRYDAFCADVFAHGGGFSKAYIVMRLTTNDGEVYTKTVEFNPNEKSDENRQPQWTAMTFDISDFEGRNRVASIAFGYFTALWDNGTDPTWGAAFALDNIYARPDASGGVQGGPPAAKGFETVDYGQTDVSAGQRDGAAILKEEAVMAPPPQQQAGEAVLGQTAELPENRQEDRRPAVFLLAGLPVMAAVGTGIVIYRRRRRARTAQNPLL